MMLLNSNPKKQTHLLYTKSKKFVRFKSPYKNIGYFILGVLYNEIQKEMRVRKNAF